MIPAWQLGLTDAERKAILAVRLKLAKWHALRGNKMAIALLRLAARRGGLC
jgi:hypothetical protein